MSQVDLDYQATEVSYGQMATILNREISRGFIPIQAEESKQMSGVLITGDSGIGKTALAKAVSTTMTAQARKAGLKWHYPLFSWSTGGHSRYIEIPGTDGYHIPAVLDALFDCLESDPHACPILLEDEALSSDPGFQSALQKLHDGFGMGDRRLTPDQRSRLFIIATGNTKRDGNKTVQANSYWTARMAKYRLSPDTADFMESVVRTGIVRLHPLVIDFLQSDQVNRFWLQSIGGHKCNPRSLEAISQRLYAITDPMTGMLDTSDDATWADNRVWLAGFNTMELVDALMARNEKLSHLTKLSDITADPDGAKLPTGTIGEMMQLMLIESFMTGPNPSAEQCIPHFYRYCKRFSTLVAPAISAMVVRVTQTLQANGRTLPVELSENLDDWDTALLSLTLANSFREIEKGSIDLSVDGIGGITGDAEKQADTRLSKRALASDPIAEYIAAPDKFRSAQTMAAMAAVIDDAAESAADETTSGDAGIDAVDQAIQDIEDETGIIEAPITPPPLPVVEQADELDWD